MTFLRKQVRMFVFFLLDVCWLHQVRELLQEQCDLKKKAFWCFRFSEIAREPAKTAAGDHVSHQNVGRQAHFSQTCKNGVGGGQLGPEHTWRESSRTQWEQANSRSSEVETNDYLYGASRHVKRRLVLASGHLLCWRIYLAPPVCWFFRVTREAALDINTEPSQSEQIVWDDPTAREERAKLADNLQWPGSPSQHSEPLAPAPPPSAESGSQLKDSMTDSELVEIGKSLMFSYLSKPRVSKGLFWNL